MHDNPYHPICKRCRELIAREGDATPIAYLTPDDRYVEKLATPDVTIADLIGDVDPIKAARGGHDLSSELTVHYGLLPRANRGIFAVNELPDLAGKIQVGLFNIMQEGDVQIKGYPLRMPLDVALVFTARKFARTIPARWKKALRSRSRKPGHAAMAWNCTYPNMSTRWWSALRFWRVKTRKSISAPA